MEEGGTRTQTARQHATRTEGVRWSDVTGRTTSAGITPIDRRTLLGQAAIAGAAFAAGGLLDAAGGGRPVRGAGERHGLLRPVRRDRRAGGHPEVRPQGLRRRRRRDLRADHRSDAVRQPRQGRGAGRQGLDRRARRPSRRLRHLPERGPQSAASATCRGRSRPSRRRSSSTASSARRRSSTSRIAGDVRHGRQQGRRSSTCPEGADINATHLRPALPVGEEHPQEHGTEPVRPSRRRRTG